MRKLTVLVSLIFVLLSAVSCLAQETPQPEAVVEKMAFKFARGITNVATSLVEIPKQSYLMVRDRGNVGYVVGPLKGIGMALYRVLTGATETIFFMVPQPGYFDPMLEPEYVWEGWEAKRAEQPDGKGE